MSQKRTRNENSRINGRKIETTSKQDTTQIDSDLNLINNEVLDALTGVSYIENNRTTMVM